MWLGFWRPAGVAPRSPILRGILETRRSYAPVSRGFSMRRISAARRAVLRDFWKICGNAEPLPISYETAAPILRHPFPAAGLFGILSKGAARSLAGRRVLKDCQRIRPIPAIFVLCPVLRPAPPEAPHRMPDETRQKRPPKASRSRVFGARDAWHFGNPPGPPTRRPCGSVFGDPPELRPVPR